MKSILWLSLAVLLLAAPGRNARCAETNHNFAIWEKEISAYEKMDATNPPAKGGFVFTGSSTIARWKTLAQDFTGQPVLNRGFGGSELCDAMYCAALFIFPYAPRKIFLRAGGNDIANGKSPGQVFADFQEFVAVVHAKLPATEIYFISWSPSGLRWKQHDKEKALDTMVADFIRGKAHLQYIET